MERETWAPIRGFEQRYLVSNLGNILSLTHKGHTRKTPRQLRPKRKNNGYFCVALCDGVAAKPKYKHIHHLVLEAFVGPRPDGMEAAHGDGNPANNTLANLRWATPKENRADKLKHGTSNRGNAAWNAKLNPDLVREIRKLSASGLRNVDIAQRIGFDRGVVGAVVRGDSWGHVQ